MSREVEVVVEEVAEELEQGKGPQVEELRGEADAMASEREKSATDVGPVHEPGLPPGTDVLPDPTLSMPGGEVGGEQAQAALEAQLDAQVTEEASAPAPAVVELETAAGLIAAAEEEALPASPSAKGEALPARMYDIEALRLDIAFAESNISMLAGRGGSVVKAAAPTAVAATASSSLPVGVAPASAPPLAAEAHAAGPVVGQVNPGATILDPRVPVLVQGPPGGTEAPFLPAHRETPFMWSAERLGGRGGGAGGCDGPAPSALSALLRELRASLEAEAHLVSRMISIERECEGIYSRLFFSRAQRSTSQGICGDGTPVVAFVDYEEVVFDPREAQAMGERLEELRRIEFASRGSETFEIAVRMLKVDAMLAASRLDRGALVDALDCLFAHERLAVADGGASPAPSIASLIGYLHAWILRAGAWLLSLDSGRTPLWLVAQLARTPGSGDWAAGLLQVPAEHDPFLLSLELVLFPPEPSIAGAPGTSTIAGAAASPPPPEGAGAAPVVVPSGGDDWELVKAEDAFSLSTATAAVPAPPAAPPALTAAPASAPPALAEVESRYPLSESDYAQLFEQFQLEALLMQAPEEELYPLSERLCALLLHAAAVNFSRFPHLRLRLGKAIALVVEVASSRATRGGPGLSQARFDSFFVKVSNAFLGRGALLALLSELRFSSVCEATRLSFFRAVLGLPSSVPCPGPPAPAVADLPASAPPGARSLIGALLSNPVHLEYLAARIALAGDHNRGVYYLQALVHLALPSDDLAWAATFAIFHIGYVSEATRVAYFRTCRDLLAAIIQSRREAVRVVLWAMGRWEAFLGRAALSLVDRIGSFDGVASEDLAMLGRWMARKPDQPLAQAGVKVVQRVAERHDFDAAVISAVAEAAAALLSANTRPVVGPPGDASAGPGAPQALVAAEVSAADRKLWAGFAAWAWPVLRSCRARSTPEKEVEWFSSTLRGAATLYPAMLSSQPEGGPVGGGGGGGPGRDDSLMPIVAYAALALTNVCSVSHSEASALVTLVAPHHRDFVFDDVLATVAAESVSPSPVSAALSAAFSRIKTGAEVEELIRLEPKWWCGRTRLVDFWLSCVVAAVPNWTRNELCSAAVGRICQLAREGGFSGDVRHFLSSQWAALTAPPKKKSFLGNVLATIAGAGSAGGTGGLPLRPLALIPEPHAVETLAQAHLALEMLSLETHVEAEPREQGNTSGLCALPRWLAYAMLVPAASHAAHSFIPLFWQGFFSVYLAPTRSGHVLGRSMLMHDKKIQRLADGVDRRLHDLCSGLLTASAGSDGEDARRELVILYGAMRLWYAHPYVFLGPLDSLDQSFDLPHLLTLRDGPWNLASYPPSTAAAAAASAPQQAASAGGSQPLPRGARLLQASTAATYSSPPGAAPPAGPSYHRPAPPLPSAAELLAWQEALGDGPTSPSIESDWRAVILAAQAHREQWDQCTALDAEYLGLLPSLLRNERAVTRRSVICEGKVRGQPCSRPALLDVYHTTKIVVQEVLARVESNRRNLSMRARHVAPTPQLCSAALRLSAAPFPADAVTVWFFRMAEAHLGPLGRFSILSSVTRVALERLGAGVDPIALLRHLRENPAQVPGLARYLHPGALGPADFATEFLALAEARGPPELLESMAAACGPWSISAPARLRADLMRSLAPRASDLEVLCEAFAAVAAAAMPESFEAAMSPALAVASVGPPGSPPPSPALLMALSRSLLRPEHASKLPPLLERESYVATYVVRTSPPWWTEPVRPALGRLLLSCLLRGSGRFDLALAAHTCAACTDAQLAEFAGEGSFLARYARSGLAWNEPSAELAAWDSWIPDGPGDLAVLAKAVRAGAEPFSWRIFCRLPWLGILSAPEARTLFLETTLALVARAPLPLDPRVVKLLAGFISALDYSQLSVETYGVLLAGLKLAPSPTAKIQVRTPTRLAEVRKAENEAERNWAVALAFLEMASGDPAKLWHATALARGPALDPKLGALFLKRIALALAEVQGPGGAGAHQGEAARIEVIRAVISSGADSSAAQPLCEAVAKMPRQLARAVLSATRYIIPLDHLAEVADACCAIPDDRHLCLFADFAVPEIDEEDFFAACARGARLHVLSLAMAKSRTAAHVPWPVLLSPANLPAVIAAAAPASSPQNSFWRFTASLLVTRVMNDVKNRRPTDRGVKELRSFAEALLAVGKSLPRQCRAGALFVQSRITPLHLHPSSHLAFATPMDKMKALGLNDQEMAIIRSPDYTLKDHETLW